MPRGRPYQDWARSGPNRSRAWFFAAACAFVVVVAAAFAYVWSQPMVDPITGCRKDGPPSAVTVILVDVTDKLTLSQRLALENRFAALALGGEGLPRIAPQERVELYLTAGQPLAERPQPLAALCNPGSERDVSELTENVPFVRQRWKRAFADPFATAVQEALDRPKEPRSFIFASVQIAVQLLRRPEFGDAPRRLILVSDLLENADPFNFYRALPTADEVIGSRRFLSLRTDFSGLDVEIWYLRRPAENVDWRAVLALWSRVLALQGAEGRVDVINIDG